MQPAGSRRTPRRRTRERGYGSWDRPPSTGRSGCASSAAASATFASSSVCRRSSSHALPVIRKQHGHFLDDFRPGQVFRHKRGKTITEGLFAVFTDFSMTTNPLSKNARYARAFGFRDMVVPPGLVMAVVFSQSVEDVS